MNVDHETIAEKIKPEGLLARRRLPEQASGIASLISTFKIKIPVLVAQLLSVLTLFSHF
jgi:hypothetical protein